MEIKRKIVSTSIEVMKPNYLDIKGGGWYNLNEDNETEATVVKLHILQHMIGLMIENKCENGEITTHCNKEIMAAADKLFSIFQGAIAHGVDVFQDTDNYEQHSDPLITHMMRIQRELKSALECSDNSVEVGYICGLSNCLSTANFVEYRKMFKQMLEFFEERELDPYWVKYVKL
jgi:hypothetical protein